MPPGRQLRLAQIAAAEFATYGYERASLNRIIRAAGMSKSSFYHFVGSKHALFDQVIVQGGRALIEALNVPRPAALREQFWPQVTALIGRLAALDGSQQWLADVGRMFHLPDAPRTPGSALHTAWTRIDAWIQQAVTIGRQVRAIGNDLPGDLQAELALTVLGVMDRWSLRQASDLTVRQRQELGRAELDAVRRLLGGGRE
ncbi:TetR/AcrR family transcriptional regulator [Micromonospora deserti]|uniref:TetR/AcrR family transcriptional regulator n=2 Tax=Micromonospora deserti TaxID=2070366 RepID=A0A2W2DLL3_9ACTN|nr:TetR/AcrR family transcriptional regulator [Micromonospora deserti]